MIKFFSGLAIGIVSVLAVQWYGPGNIKQNAADGYAAAEEKVDEFRADTCQKRYLEATGCFSYFPQKICDSEISKACDKSNPNYHGMIPQVSPKERKINEVG